MPEFAFDLNMRAAVRVQASDEAEARKFLDDALGGGLDTASGNFGAWPNGDPITGECTMEGRPRLYLVDGDDADDETVLLWPSDGPALLTALRDLVAYVRSIANPELMSPEGRAALKSAEAAIAKIEHAS